jgi:hypothetical protein
MRTEPSTIQLHQRNICFLTTPPFHASKHYAKLHGYDLVVPNTSGIGNVLMFSRLVEDYAFAAGRRIRLLTAPFRPTIGVVEDEEEYPVWANNPFVREIGNADQIDPEIMPAVNAEVDNYCQYSHVIENICSAYGLRPRALRASIYLAPEEMAWAMEQLEPYPRPVIAVHPYSKTAPGPGHPWHRERWADLVIELAKRGTVLEIHKHDVDDRKLPAVRFATRLRQMFALIWASDVFVGLDSSPSHVATAFCKPAVVLWEPMQKLKAEEGYQAGFAPAVLLRWGYPQNRNLFLLGERGNEVIDQVLDYVDTEVTSSRIKVKRSSVPFQDHFRAS